MINCTVAKGRNKKVEDLGGKDLKKAAGARLGDERVQWKRERENLFRIFIHFHISISRRGYSQLVAPARAFCVASQSLFLPAWRRGSRLCVCRFRDARPRYFACVYARTSAFYTRQTASLLWSSEYPLEEPNARRVIIMSVQCCCSRATGTTGKNNNPSARITTRGMLQEFRLQKRAISRSPLRRTIVFYFGVYSRVFSAWYRNRSYFARRLYRLQD